MTRAFNWVAYLPLLFGRFNGILGENDPLRGRGVFLAVDDETTNTCRRPELCWTSPKLNNGFEKRP